MSEIMVTIAGQTRPATADEIKQLEKDWADEAKYLENKAKELADAAAKKAIAEAKLAALGLTADDLKALGL